LDFRTELSSTHGANHRCKQKESAFHRIGAVRDESFGRARVKVYEGLFIAPVGKSSILHKLCDHTATGEEPNLKKKKSYVEARDFCTTSISAQFQTATYNDSRNDISKRYW
jgi:hypothetical protein